MAKVSNQLFTINRPCYKEKLGITMSIKKFVTNLATFAFIYNSNKYIYYLTKFNY